MNKMRTESMDMTAQNIEEIGALFPNCITETKDADGKLKMIDIDMKALKLIQRNSMHPVCKSNHQKG